MSRSKTTARLLRALIARSSGSACAAAPCAVPIFDVARSGAVPLLVPGGGFIASSVPFASSVFSRGISTEALQPSDGFVRRHNSPTSSERQQMLETVGFKSLEDLVSATIPPSIVRRDGMPLGKYHEPTTESDFLDQFKSMMKLNKINKSYIGMGYYNTYTPPVILRNILENPGWYTQYTPYQAEISQGRLESLLNFQSMVTDLTAMPLSNSSLLDEATAAAEGMTMCSALARGKKPKFLISSNCHPQTIAVTVSRADGLGLETVVLPDAEIKKSFSKEVCGCLIQYPGTDGSVSDPSELVAAAHAAGAKVVVATDLLALTKLTPPGEWGADIVVGSAQRFGVPMGYGGPHAAFLATAEDNKRLMPGRIIGVSVDATGSPALRMAMQTREQHIRRDKATSNICTAQALLANMAAMYAIYHGPAGLDKIATRVNGLASIFAAGVRKLGMEVVSTDFFDTVTVKTPGMAKKILEFGHGMGINVRMIDSDTVSVAMDETTKIDDVDNLFVVFSLGSPLSFKAESLANSVTAGVGKMARKSPFLQQPIFNIYHSEHEMLRYLKRLENKDLSLCHSMIPLGSCTMKLNATSEMMPVTWPELGQLHPFCPPEQAKGYQAMFDSLAAQLCSITGFDAMSLQPNAGAAGEYAGLMAIRAYHQSNGDTHRDVCIIPVSAHGTNPASAVMAGMKIVTVGTDSHGNIDMQDLKAKVESNKDKLAALMVTYPSTHGVYEEGIDTICKIIHEAGGQVYMDGANMNAQVGLTSPGHIGADVCHLNLHKTFCIPHGGGGPGMGPIGVKAHLAPFLPSHPVVPTGGLPVPAGKELKPFGTMAAAPYGSSSILAISYAYITMMGSKGLKEATSLAILNANYMASRLEKYYTRLFKGKNGTNAHEFILDCRAFKESGIEVEDIAKRLIDYGYHAPTMSWPVPGTLMIEPTESESKSELDRFVNAMISIREEIAKVERGEWPQDNNPLVHAPHTAAVVMSDSWDRPYSREVAAFPADWVKQAKFWPTVSRVDNVYGDRHLVTKLETAVEAVA